MEGLTFVLQILSLCLLVVIKILFLIDFVGAHCEKLDFFGFEINPVY